MKIKPGLIAAFLMLALAAHVPAALADDFNLHVRLQLNELHRDVAKIKISCTIRASGTGSWVKEQLVDVTNNAINRTVTVRINAQPPTAAAEGRFYSCYFQLVNSDGRVESPSHGFCDASRGEWNCTKDGSTFISFANQQIP